MKASELLNAAIPHYGNDDYMCHVLSGLAEGDEYPEVLKNLKYHIDSILATQDTITLMNYMWYTNTEYHELENTHGHYSEQCHNMRIQFWRDMVNELQAAGL